MGPWFATSSQSAASEASWVCTAEVVDRTLQYKFCSMKAMTAPSVRPATAKSRLAAQCGRVRGASTRAVGLHRASCSPAYANAARGPSRIRAATLEKTVSDVAEKTMEVAEAAQSIATGANREEAILMQGEMA